MASPKTKRRKTQQNARNAAVRGNAADITFQVIIFLAAFAIIVSRRPDAVLNAQFYAEDGMVWYPDAYRFGVHSVVMPVAGYLHVFTRLVALFTVLLPFSLAPLVMNLCAIVVQILPVNIFLSSRFSHIPVRMRLLGSFLYLVIPNSWEINANITNVQWHLVLLACLVLLAQPANGRAWRIFDGAVLLLTSFSSPIAVLLVPVAAALWWHRRLSWSAFSLALLIPGATVEALVALFSHTRSVDPIGASFVRFVHILGRQVFLSSILGWKAQLWLAPGPGLLFIAVIATAAGLAVLFYALRYGPLELKAFIGFSFGVFALGLARPLAGAPNHPQWVYLCIPGRGNRYYFLPMLGFLASLLWMATHAPALRGLRYFALLLLLSLPVGIFLDWSYPPLDDYQFHKYAEQFELAPSGTKIAIPINPGMTMEITKQ